MAKRKQGPAGNPDYIEHGSDRHAAMLGLKKAEAHDVPQLDGWALQDVTQYGPSARPEFLEQTLRQKVSELTTPPPKMQSGDPFEPHYAPPLWQPGG
jgi:hypothetical protein